MAIKKRIFIKMKNFDFNPIDSKMIMPLVFHKIVEGNAEDWEDVNKDYFENFLDIIGKNHVVFRPNGKLDGTGWCITFDDGNISDYDIAYPILKSKGIRATFFLILSQVGKKGYLDWPKVLEMHHHGMSFGSHGLNHLSMNTLSAKDAYNELKISKDILEDKIGEHVSSFSYPYGEYNFKTHKIAKNVGYNFIFTSDHGIEKRNATILPRNNVHSAMNLSKISDFLRPSISLRAKWAIEDSTKTIIKGIIGRKNYIKIRELIIHD
jgi:peptidoglycan/xylan/chitin deacetylase (PgdA/CDA1 family)